MHEKGPISPNDFLNTVYFRSSYTAFDAELHLEFFELVYMFVTWFIIELLTKNRSKNRRWNFADPMASEKALSPDHSQFDQIAKGLVDSSHSLDVIFTDVN